MTHLREYAHTKYLPGDRVKITLDQEAVFPPVCCGQIGIITNIRWDSDSTWQYWVSIDDEGSGCFCSELDISKAETVQFKKLNGKAVAPYRKHPDDAGFDLTVTSVEKIGDFYKYGFGIAISMPVGSWGDVRARSSVYKTGLVLTNGCGVIDISYRGEIGAVFYHADKSLKPYEVGDRACQLIITNVDPALVKFVEVDQLEDTIRGNGGFGSTGLKGE